MEKVHIPMIGMRKIKSVLAVILAFFIWQLVRIFFPQFDVHPLFGYIYAVIEMRESVEKTKTFGLLRIKATFVGLTIGLGVLWVSVLLSGYIKGDMLVAILDLALISLGVLVTLWVADFFKCKNFCGIAAIILVICMVRDRDSDTNIYLYAILRVMQTLIGVFSAWLVNSLVHRYPNAFKKIEKNWYNIKTLCYMRILNF